MIARTIISAERKWGNLPGLGSDDTLATHLLILDQKNETMAIAPMQDGHHLLDRQHPSLPPMSPDEVKRQRAAVLEFLNGTGFETASPQQLNRSGMFELFTPPDPSLVRQRQAMTDFLDCNLDPQIRQWLQRFQGH